MDDETFPGVKALLTKTLDLIADEIKRPELQVILKHKIITPLINLLYSELYPYIMILSVTISIIFLISILTFVCFVIYYFKKL
jgi:hypothetical protein